MTHFNSRTIVAALLVTATVATYAVAQEPSKSGANQSDDQQTQSNQQNQSNNQQGGQENQKQDASSNERGTAGQDRNQDNRSSNNSQDQANRDSQRDSGRDAQRDSSAKSDRKDRSDADNARVEERKDSRDRSGRDDARNGDSRARRSDDGRSREQASSRRSEMRGPDIGIWFNRSTRDGLVIADISTKGAIAKLGFREGDRLISVNGRRITSEAEFVRFLLHSDVDRVKVIIIRDEREQTIIVEPRVLIEEYEYTEVDPLEQFGIIPDDRYDDRIVVWRVIPRSPAYYAGFRAGDIIVRFGDRSYRTRTEFERGAGDWKAGEVNVQVRRGERTRDLSVDVPRFERRSDRTARREERTERRDSLDGAPAERGTVDRAEYRDEGQSQPSQRGGLLRGRGNR